jgi:DNA-binding NtrC family response regulator
MLSGKAKQRAVRINGADRPPEEWQRYDRSPVYRRLSAAGRLSLGLNGCATSRDIASRQFRGKLIAATNRDLAAFIRNGRFREDLYYRLCSDQITTPSLSEQLGESPGVIHELIAYMARRVAGAEAEDLAFEVLTWVDEHLGPDYPWPGNYRELEQCVKNVLIRRDYQSSRPKIQDPIERSVQEFRTGSLTAEQLLSRYCTIVYRQTGSYEETARRLQLDRRTAAVFARCSPTTSWGKYFKGPINQATVFCK